MNNISKHNIELQNMKSLSIMNDFIKSVFFSYFSIYKVLLSLYDELLKIQNDSIFQIVDNILIESCNKSISYMYDNITSILSQTIHWQGSGDTLIIKPVNIDKNLYSHKLELTYFLSFDSYITKSLGDITNISIIKLNDRITLSRSIDTYQFNIIDLTTVINSEDFRTHIQNYLNIIKNLLGLFYNDIKYSKILLRSLLDIMTDTLKIKLSSEHTLKWKKLILKFKYNIDFIKKNIKEL
jgi:hypothetical protein